MAEENVTVAILLNNENIPKEVFLNSVDEYFGPQVEDFKNSSLSICVLSDKTGASPSKANAAVFLKSQWLFQTILVPDLVFEFKLVICENQSWNIILSENSFENRLIKTFKVPDDKAIVVHLEWNKPHTVSVEPMIELYSMDESLIKSHYENQDVSESFKNLETITEDNCDDESLLDLDLDKSKISNDDNDTDDSLETGNEFHKNKLELTNDELSDSLNNKIETFDENIVNEENENLKNIDGNKSESTAENHEESFKRKTKRKVVLLGKIQSILGVKSDLAKIKSTNILKEENNTNSNFLIKEEGNLNQNENIIFPCENSDIEYDVLQDLNVPEVEINSVLPHLSNGNEFYSAETSETITSLDSHNKLNAESSIHSSEKSLCSKENFDLIKFENQIITNAEFSEMEECENKTDEELRLKVESPIVAQMPISELNITESSENLDICEKCESPNILTAKVIDDFPENTSEIENDLILQALNKNTILTYPYSCVLVTPLNEVKITDNVEFSNIENTFENVSAEFYHEIAFQPVILHNDTVPHELSSQAVSNDINSIEDENIELNFKQNIPKTDLVEPESDKPDSKETSERCLITHDDTVPHELPSLQAVSNDMNSIEDENIELNFKQNIPEIDLVETESDKLDSKETPERSLITHDDTVPHELPSLQAVSNDMNSIEDENIELNFKQNIPEIDLVEPESDKLDPKETTERTIITHDDNVTEEQEKNINEQDFESDFDIDNKCYNVEENSLNNNIVFSEKESFETLDPNEIKMNNTSNVFMQVSEGEESQITKNNLLISNEECKVFEDAFNEKENESPKESTTEETKPTVSAIIYKFENLQSAESNSRKNVLDIEKDKNRISCIVKQFEDLNTHEEIKENNESKIIENKIKIEEKLNDSPIEHESVESKNTVKNEIHLEKINSINKNKDNTENMSELVINDDYKYPDSVTPTKVEQGLSLSKVYDVPFIDDEVFLKENSFRDNKEMANKTENVGLNIANEAMIKNTPRASIETFKEIELEKIKQSIEHEQPVKKKKGILNLCGCVGGRKRS